MPKDGQIDGDQRKLLPIKCLYEIQEVSGREVMTSFMCDDNGGEYETFLLCDLSLAPMETAALFEFFGRMKSLQSLEIIGCGMEQLAYLGLANLLKKENKIKDLVIRCCGTTDDDAKHVFDALGNENCKVTCLHLGYNVFGDESTSYLRDTLKSGNCKLTELHLDNNNLTHVAVEHLSEALKNNNCKLTKLLLSGIELTDAAARYLRDALESENCQITELRLNCIELTDAAAKHLSEALKNDDCKLTKLFLNGNELSR